MFIILFIWLKWIEQYSWGNIAQVKTLFNVAWEVPDNIALAKIMCNIVLELMLLGHHCTGKNPWLCCPRLQTTIHRKKSCSICLHPLGTLYRSNTLLQCCPRDSRQHYTGKKYSKMLSIQYLVTFQPFLFWTS